MQRWVGARAKVRFDPPGVRPRGVGLSGCDEALYDGVGAVVATDDGGRVDYPEVVFGGMTDYVQVHVVMPGEAALVPALAAVQVGVETKSAIT
ncbi:hypothetical protein [Deinococcus sp.]|uniref:hypothetical protein n=1 Tax=Deinococcus sp. TaxID=47478 RepID=UPI0025B92FB5|nr:hypothetical protein [Deinococcus sp.]